ncbi:MAG TPA: deoxyribodipyrimidine photo-lyase [Chitinophagaceae bacterium]|nr:deoxyribodipyrimidine photo-lyase [Chitinophagaceae bacterium]
MPDQKVTLFWFRRDLRLEDNAGLYHALRCHKNVLPVFIFDEEILQQLEDKQDARVNFIYHTVQALKQQLNEWGSDLLSFYGQPKEIFKELCKTYDIQAVYANRDYEPYARDRDAAVKDDLGKKGISFFTYKDQVIFDEAEVTKDDGSPYTVFTPYSKRWKAKLNDFYTRSYPNLRYQANFLAIKPSKMLSLPDIGFRELEIEVPSAKVKLPVLRTYQETRDFPAMENGTTCFGIHFRFGTVSIREMVRLAQKHSESWLNELIWREFFMSILWHFPYVQESAFKPKYNFIPWRNNEQEFQAWCEGRTGYPIVDAGMRQLNVTGLMHNRVRMITASFLVKHLLVDWRWGEAYFAEKLLDYDLAANNGNWQWAAGCGCDAAPYFRVFNPYEQTKRFDKDHAYIRKWVPEFEEESYPKPIVEHKFARERVLEVYRKALQG